jgi:hypothetical protein
MMRRTLLAAGAAFWLSVALIAQQPQDLYQQALRQENAAGDLDKAIALYRQAASAAGTDRSLAARALIRAAAACEKRGRQTEAAAIYADVLRHYPEQRGEVGVAQERLSKLGRDTTAENPPPVVTRLDVSSVWTPFSERHCQRCHNERSRSGGLDLSALNAHDVGRNTTQWEQVVRRLLARRDPPGEAVHPSEATYRTVIARLETALDRAYSANHTLRDAERIDSAELATRVARFIWRAAPDASLLADATSGRLQDRAVLERHIARMLRDPRSSSLVDGFFAEWLALDRVRTATPDPSRFPHADAELLQAMDTETRLFLGDQLRSDRDAMNIWTADYTYVNARLAHHYGMADVTGHEFRRVTWPDDRRGGLLGQAAILTASSTPSRTSPTQRGRFVLSHLFGVDTPSPPANVPPLAETGPPSGRTMRERLRGHKINPSCAACHSIFDPIGLALENFDAVGAWRTQDGGASIDASGAFADGTRFDGPAGLRAALLNYRQAYYSGLTRQLLAYALNRRGKSGQVYDYEMPSVRAIVRASAADGYRWSSLLAGVAASAPFQMKHLVP